MFTPDERTEIYALIDTQTLRLPDSDCRIFTGVIRDGTNDPVVYLGHRMVGVKAFLAPRVDREPGAFPIFRTTCGTGRRCVNPAHNYVRRNVPMDEVRGWWTEARQRRAAARALRERVSA